MPTFSLHIAPQLLADTASARYECSPTSSTTFKSSTEPYLRYPA